MHIIPREGPDRTAQHIRHHQEGDTKTIKDKLNCEMKMLFGYDRPIADIQLNQANTRK
jgi:hypothetical protein